MNDNNPYAPPKTPSLEKKKHKFPWNLAIRWSILVLAVFGLVGSIILTIQFWDHMDILQLALPLLFLSAAILLVKRKKLAVYLFAIHLVWGYSSTVTSAPSMLSTPMMILGWFISILAIITCVYMWQKKALT
ncbi:MAG: hypothetical protein OEZ58_06625 [Gammaproteobacteria bacterium]|nr:hypothetical protein [Gammaproteobacteria bacterium]